MAVERLVKFLRRHRLIALDTCIFIYHVEMNERYSALTECVFEWMERSNHRAVTSTITMTELLVPSYRENNEQKVDAFYALLSTYPNLQWIAPDLGAADLAARFRATHRLQTPDALMAATAVRAGATAFVTNDPVYARVQEFETAALDEYL